jgi:hypothetical protein
MEIENSIQNLIPVSYWDYYCYVPEDYDQKLRDEIISVLAKRHMGLSSVDYVKSKYIDKIPLEKRNENFVHPKNILQNEIYEVSWKLIDDVYKRLDYINFEVETVRSLAVETTIRRLANTFESASFLIKNRFFFESISLIRVIFEQLAYCANIYQYTDEEYEKLTQKGSKNFLRSTNIIELKKILADVKLGKLYSHLSSLTHIDIHFLEKYISYDKEIGATMVMLRSLDQAIEANLLFLQVVDLFTIVFEHTLQEHLKSNYKYHTIIDGKLTIDKDRSTK